MLTPLLLIGVGALVIVTQWERIKQKMIDMDEEDKRDSVWPLKADAFIPWADPVFSSGDMTEEEKNDARAWSAKYETLNRELSSADPTSWIHLMPPDAVEGVNYFPQKFEYVAQTDEVKRALIHLQTYGGGDTCELTTDELANVATDSLLQYAASFGPPGLMGQLAGEDKKEGSE